MPRETEIEFSSSVDLGDEEDVDVTVTATVSGRHMRATRMDPEEWPEVDVVAVTRQDNGVEVSELLEPRTWKRLQDEADNEAGELESDNAAEAACQREDLRDDR